ncbi:hypothetical protein [Streptomyces sp. NPDC096032]|uniref:hypothetical protein n=1 Tax=Streptomyces sp. NPDC096032 TaxID=3366070 RepID=UPI00380CAEDB
MELDIAADLQRLWEASVAVKDHHREWEEPHLRRSQRGPRELISQKSPTPESEGEEDEEAA